jgi:DNA-binding TFAR19-related protein (PDSD5 family)
MQIDQGNLNQFNEAQQQREQLAQLEQAVKQKLSKSALERFGNIKVAYPDKAVQVTLMLAKLISEHGVDVIEDYHLKELLKKLSEKREIKIKRR